MGRAPPSTGLVRRGLLVGQRDGHAFEIGRLSRRATEDPFHGATSLLFGQFEFGCPRDVDAVGQVLHGRLSSRVHPCDPCDTTLSPDADGWSRALAESRREDPRLSACESMIIVVILRRVIGSAARRQADRHPRGRQRIPRRCVQRRRSRCRSVGRRRRGNSRERKEAALLAYSNMVRCEEAFRRPWRAMCRSLWSGPVPARHARRCIDMGLLSHR
jgi:hypothetical protein